MKKLMIAVSAVGLLAVSQLAALADEASGSIKSIDATAMTVTLTDATTYKLPTSVDAASLKVAEKVNIDYTKGADGQMTATTVTPAT
jgi:hypothetical protein